MTQLDGFVPLADYDEENRSRQSGHSPEWKVLRAAIDEGSIDGFQHGGSKRWLVNKAQADALLERGQRRQPVCDDRLARIELMLGTILGLLEAKE
jgi:hypothetical protein